MRTFLRLLLLLLIHYVWLWIWVPCIFVFPVYLWWCMQRKRPG